jgi:transcriptional regulator with XRE-family HTH domain
MFESPPGKVWTPPNEGARLLKRAMDRQKLSQYRVERDTGAARGMVSMWLSGLRRPGVEWAERLRAKYGIAPLAWHRPARKPRTKSAAAPAAGNEPADLSQPAA